MTWAIEVKSSEYGTYHNPDRYEVLNIVGAAKTAGVTYPTDGRNQQAGLIRREITSIVGTVVTISQRPRTSDDYPAFSNPLVYPPTTTLTLGVDVAASAQVGDIWEEGYGTVYDSAAVAWKRVRNSGILVEGQVGLTLFVKLTNSGSRPKAFCRLGWDSSGAPLWEGRLSDGPWLPESHSPLWLIPQASTHQVEGLVLPGEVVVAEFRAVPSASNLSSENPYILSLEYSGIEI